jgi:hypothetical protein
VASSPTKDLFYQLARASGYCCINSFLVANRKIRGGLLAKKLGIHPRTLRYWRRAHRLGKISRCSCCPRLLDFYIPLEVHPRGGDT